MHILYNRKVSSDDYKCSLRSPLPQQHNVYPLYIKASSTTLYIEFYWSIGNIY